MDSLTTFERTSPFDIGNAAIAFRFDNNPAGSFYHRYPYILNSKGDGWFRKDSGLGDGYGLVIRSIRVTSRKPIEHLDGTFHKAIIDYTDVSGRDQREPFWLYVSKHFTLEEVLNYIESNKSKWII